MTSKESLENICNGCKSNGCVHRVVNNHCVNYEDIDQDLDRLEQLEDNIKIHKETIKMQHNQIESFHTENYKLKKVIEIIKTKIIVLVALKLSKNLDDYNRMTNFENLTQEEYDLLKDYL